MAQDPIKPSCKMVMIGGSAGSLGVVLQILSTLNRDRQYVVAIILHRKSSTESSLASLLADRASWPVKEVDDKEAILPQHIYLAPGDYHLLVEKDQHLSLDMSEKINFSRPSIDAGFESAADAYGDQLIAVLLSGANADGVRGMQSVKQKGGICIVQDPASAEVPYMPREAVARVAVDFVVDGKEIGALLNDISWQKL